MGRFGLGALQAGAHAPSYKAVRPLIQAALSQAAFRRRIFWKWFCRSLAFLKVRTPSPGYLLALLPGPLLEVAKCTKQSSRLSC